MTLDIDTYDLCICVALWGGFETGIWLPAIALVGWLMFSDWHMTLKSVE